MLPGAAAGGPRDGAGRSPFAAPSRDPGFSSYLSHDSFGNYDPPVYESVNNPNPVPHRQAFNSL
ncbi:hypothetical protein DIPPA_15078 [Diplonema papillatum]|nr:hypothetical protein DIPPA_15078 [Diplonema papillatum]